MYDVIIIGAGVTGCAVARELSRYKVNVCVLDKEEDVCSGTSKANSAIIHAGFDAPAGSLMARFNVRGNEMMDDYARDLDIPFKRNGAMVVCIHKEALGGLQELYDRGIANGVKELRILNREEALEMEPNLSENTQGALYAPTSGIICPFMLNIAMAENARKYTSAEDCLQLKIAVLDGSTHETLAKENGFVIMAKDSTENALKAVSDGSADAAIVNSIYATTAIGKGNEFPDLARSFRLKNNKIGFAFRKDSELATKMNDYFVTVYTSGQMKQMASKYAIQKLITEQVTEQ